MCSIAFFFGVLQRCLMSNLSVPLWSTYLNFVNDTRRNEPDFRKEMVG